MSKPSSPATMNVRPKRTYYGKYRGTVINNIDPMQIGRIQVAVPAVSAALPSSWAMPCLPGAAFASGLFTMPNPGAGVWVEFEQGDPDYPIWVGGYWGSAAEVPTMAKVIPPGVDAVTIETVLQNAIVVSDVPGPTGGILLRTATGAMISISSAGIVISNGMGATISLVGPTVDVNAGALTVT